MSSVLTSEEEAAMYKQTMRERRFWHFLSTASFAYIACTANVEVGSMSFWARVGLVASILGLCSDKQLAFLDQTASKLLKGKAPIGDDDTKTPFIPTK